jgi:hypothetical protein
MTPDRLKELRALCDAAQPGPWRYSGDKDGRIDTGPPDITDWEDGYVIYGVDRDEDARFIVAARTALPEALDEIERLREALRVAMLRWFHEAPCGVYDPDEYEDVEAMLDGPTENSNADWKRCKAALLGEPPAGSR